MISSKDVNIGITFIIFILQENESLVNDLLNICGSIRFSFFYIRYYKLF